MDKIAWKSAVWAAVIAAAVMLVLELVMNPLFLGAPLWGPPRMMAAIVLGQEVLPPPATFDIGIILAAVVVHLILSLLYAIILVFIIRGMPMSSAVLVGGSMGLLLYFINFYGFTAVFPWFENARNWVQIVIHIVFGITVAWTFKAIQEKKRAEPSHENKF